MWISGFPIHLSAVLFIPPFSGLSKIIWCCLSCSLVGLFNGGEDWMQDLVDVRALICQLSRLLLSYCCKKATYKIKCLIGLNGFRGLWKNYLSRKWASYHIGVLAKLLKVELVTFQEPLLLEFSLFITLHSCLGKAVYFSYFLSHFLTIIFSFYQSFWMFITLYFIFLIFLYVLFIHIEIFS